VAARPDRIPDGRRSYAVTDRNRLGELPHAVNARQFLFLPPLVALARAVAVLVTVIRGL
jgi:hypothetical protein